jgi:cysteinyl-tRNA synthetase
MEVVLKLRAQAKANKDYATSDRIRESLKEIGIQIMDSKEGSVWSKI